MTTPTTSGPHHWQQPTIPLEVSTYDKDHDYWYRVLFIRPCEGAHGGWEVITFSGTLWRSADVMIREATR